MSSVSRSSVVVGQAAQDLTLAQFTAILEAGSSPALVDASKCYFALKTVGVSIAFATAIFLKESTFGTEGFATANKNPGNTRSTTTGIGFEVTTTKGLFIRYPNWYEGFKDMAWRLVKPDYYYALEGRRTIEQIITRWAPPEDGNDTEGYINSVVANMNKWIGGTSMGEIWPTAAELGFPVRIHRAAAKDIGPERELLTVNKDVVHDAEGGFWGAEDELTRDDSKIASCHALIGQDASQGIVASVPLNRTAWTPGNDAVALESINVELAGFQSDGYTDFQYQALAAYHRWAVSKGCPIPAVYVGRTGKPGILGHQDVPDPYKPGYFGGASNHTDPGPRFEWNKYVAYCQKGVTAVPEKIDLPYGAHFDNAGALVFPVAGVDIPVNFGFLEFFLTLGRNLPLEKTPDRIFNSVRLFGLPKEPEHTDADGKSRQRFERYKMAYDPKGVYGWELAGEFVS